MRFFLENEVEDVYGLLTGTAVPTSKIPSLVKNMHDTVKNAFAEGGSCAEFEEKIYELRKKIASRLGSSIEDPDLLEMAEMYEQIQKTLCKETFIYSRLLLQDENLK